MRAAAAARATIGTDHRKENEVMGLLHGHSSQDQHLAANGRFAH
jgi:hypothetical protein